MSEVQVVFDKLGANNSAKKLQIYIVVRKVRGIYKKGTPDFYWLHKHAILDSSICDIEKLVGIFPGHNQKGVEGPAIWKDDFDAAYAALENISPIDFLAEYCNVKENEWKSTFDDTKDEIPALFRLYKKIQHRVQRMAPDIHKFSDEIEVYHTISKLISENTYRVTIYIKDQNGKIIDSSKTQARTKDPARRTEVVEKKMVTQPKLRHAAIVKVLSGYHFPEFSLKTFWYLNLDRLEKTFGYKKDAEKLFLSGSFSQRISACTLHETRFEEYNIAMQYLFKAPFFGDEEAKDLAWRQLAMILREAYRQSLDTQGYLSNSLRDLYKSAQDKYNKEDLKIRAVRDALVKKTFSIDEERRIYEHTRSLLEEFFDSVPEESNNIWDHVGVLIRLFTGLSPGEVCALKWEDYCTKKSPAVSYLKVSKSIEADTNIPIPFDKKERYRLVPVTSLLSQVLEDVKKRVTKILQNKNEKDVNESEQTLDEMIAETPIIANKNELTLHCKPKKLRETTQIILKKCSPDNTELETYYNGGRYRGDILRSNFKYKALNACDMSLGEIQYLLGFQPPDTFSRHYCDFTNQFSQLALSIKLERWVAQFKTFSDFPQSLPIAAGKSHTANPFNDEKTTVHVQFDIVSKEKSGCEAATRLTVRSTYGMSATAVLARSAEKNE